MASTGRLGRHQPFHDQGKRNGKAEVRHEAANDDRWIVIVRVIGGGNHDCHMHDNPGKNGVEQGHESRFVPALTEVRPDRGEEDPPRHREYEMDTRTHYIGPYTDGLLYLLAEDEPGSVARDAGHGHQVLHPDPNNSLVNPDD